MNIALLFAGQGPNPVVVLIPLFIVFIVITAAGAAGMWKVFTKAGEPGWAVLVPIYNFIVMLKIAGKPMWFIVLLCVPIANAVALILIAIGIAKNFGKSAGFGIGMAFLPFIFYPMLGFSDEATFLGTEESM